jgi:hypothetical protein
VGGGVVWCATPRLAFHGYGVAQTCCCTLSPSFHGSCDWSRWCKVHSASIICNNFRRWETAVSADGIVYHGFVCCILTFSSFDPSHLTTCRSLSDVLPPATPQHTSVTSLVSQDTARGVIPGFAFHSPTCHACCISTVNDAVTLAGRSPRVTAHATVPLLGMSPSHSAEALSGGRIVPMPPSQLSSLLSSTGLCPGCDDKTLEIAKLNKHLQVPVTKAQCVQSCLIDTCLCFAVAAAAH